MVLNIFSCVELHLTLLLLSLDGMKSYFEQFGQVVDSHIMRDPTGKSRCFGFVNFADPSVLDIVLAKTHILDNKQVRHTTDGILGKLNSIFLLFCISDRLTRREPFRSICSRTRRTRTCRCLAVRWVDLVDLELWG